MDPSLDIATLHESVFAALLGVTKTVGQITAEDLPFQRSVDPQFGRSLDGQSARLLSLADKLVKTAVAGSEVDGVPLGEVDDLENNWRGVVDVVDSLLERADTSLDEYTGVIKRLGPEQQAQAETTAHSRSSKPKLPPAFRNQRIAKPQLLFRSATKNHETSPFKPLLRSKPHATVALEQSVGTYVNEGGVTLVKHPYEQEISTMQYPRSVYQHSDPRPYQPLENTTATFVDTPEAVHSMLEELKLAKEIAIDLEHHDTHSYVGLVSLMQISTRDRDWIVDTLKPWREDLQVLNEVFADPGILKVFHGAYMDIVWLQRDLGLYVVGLFDTYHAARALGYPQASLASLLSRFIHFDADKQYQMADWRIRPLPKELFDYARSDTHFLLYIYDNLRNQLITKSMSRPPDEDALRTVLQNSKETSLQVYERYVYDGAGGKGAGGWYNMLRRTPALFSKEQFAVFRAVHQWRDTVARQNDESLNYVMPKHVLFSIAKAMPSDMASLLSVSHPISQPVRSRATELLGIIGRARETGADGPDMVDLFHFAKAPPPNGSATPPVGETPEHASTVQQLRVPSLGAPQVRTEKSKFWGPAMVRLAWQDKRTDSPAEGGLHLALPLPQLTAEIFEQPQDAVPEAGQTATQHVEKRPEHEYVKDRKGGANEDDGVFVVKQLGGGRKRKERELVEPTSPGPDSDKSQSMETGALAEEDLMDLDINNVTSHDGEADKAERRARRKAQRKLEKEERTRAGTSNGSTGVERGGGDGDAEAQDSREPFDYAKAESVLHAKTRQGDGGGAKAAFNPYAKSGDAPKGMRRARKETAGKSHTFKG
ncbi:MAG: exosome nuclease subunit [Thelocarpon impressellum]|nr:MAG: exosome nuclease subunit [Thelocarpon impressellum]